MYFLKQAKSSNSMKPMTYSRAQIQFKGTHITSFIAAHANQSFILIVSLIGNLVLVRVTGNAEKKYIENNHSTKFFKHSSGHFTDNEFSCQITLIDDDFLQFMARSKTIIVMSSDQYIV